MLEVVGVADLKCEDVQDLTVLLEHMSPNRAYSLTWPATMQIYWNKRKCLHKKRVQLTILLKVR